MKERPILFNSEMVRAVMTCAKCGHISHDLVCPKCGSKEFLKTMTRRVIKPQPDVADLIGGERFYQRRKDMVWQDFSREDFVKRCPYGQVGDRLWVRETWAQIYKDTEYCIKDEGFPCPCPGCIKEYRADTNAPYPGEWEPEHAKGNPDAPKWRPSIHMPRWASRITLEITNIRVERLQEISAEDALREGMKELSNCTPPLYSKTAKQYSNGVAVGFSTARLAFADLMDKLYPGSWSRNDWVRVIEFKRVEGK